MLRRVLRALGKYPLAVAIFAALLCTAVYLELDATGFVGWVSNWYTTTGLARLVPAVTTIFAGVLALVTLGLKGVAGSEASDTVFKNLVSQREAARAAVEPTNQPETTLQETAIALYAQQLAVELNGLRTRALWAFVPGLLLCSASLAGPLVAWSLAQQHDKW